MEVTGWRKGLEGSRERIRTGMRQVLGRAAWEGRRSRIWGNVKLARSKQSILKEINPEYSLEGLTLKLQYFGHQMQRANSLKKTLRLGNIEGRSRSGQQRMRVG